MPCCKNPSLFPVLFSQNSYAFGLLLFCMNRINAMLLVCYVGISIAMILLENVEEHGCAKTLGFMLNPEFEHWLVGLLFHWPSANENISFSPLKRSVLLSGTLNYKTAMR